MPSEIDISVSRDESDVHVIVPTEFAESLYGAIRASVTAMAAELIMARQRKDSTHTIRQEVDYWLNAVFILTDSGRAMLTSLLRWWQGKLSHWDVGN